MPMMTRDVPLYTLKNAKPEQLVAVVSAFVVEMSERLARLEKAEAERESSQSAEAELYSSQ